MRRTLTLLVSLFAFAALAQMPGGPNQPDMPIDAATRAAVIDAALKSLEEVYVFPDAAKAMAASIRTKAKQKGYDAIASAQAFAEALTADLQAVSRDKHLRVRYSHQPIPERPAGTQPGEPSPEERQRMTERLRTTNYGFEKIERLMGNVGYIEIRGFVPAALGGDTADAAMTLVANSDALIIDLRRNDGGDPAMVALVSSYLFDDEPVHLNSLYWREGDTTHQWWTTPWVAGKRFGGAKPIFILTSRETFSAAEEFAYNLQARKRATIVGETTGGGAHPGGMRRIHEHFGIWVPSGRAINPITKTNWEGTGVKPDIAVAASDALKSAHIAALKSLLERAKDLQEKMRIEHVLAAVERQ